MKLKVLKNLKGYSLNPVAYHAWIHSNQLQKSINKTVDVLTSREVLVKDKILTLNHENYDRIFKEKAAQLSYERDNISQLTRELRITAALLYKWYWYTLSFGIDFQI